MRWQGPAGDAHAGPWPLDPVPSVRVVDVDGPALVLGSTQAVEVADAGRASAAGVAVVRRRSGGGAVLVGPGDLVWVDVFVPAGDRLWVGDVGRATHWLGRAWTDTLAAVGVAGEWHDGGLLFSPWSGLVCFAGLGPGEVRVGGAKAVGISQRRTRVGALFQCAALLRWNVGDLLDLLALDDEGRAAGRRELAGTAAGLDAAGPDLVRSFVKRLALE